MKKEMKWKLGVCGAMMVCSLGVTSIASAEDWEDEGDWYYISSSYEPGIAIRSEPTQDSELLCRIPYGTEFYVEEFDGNWGYTTVDGVTGWIDTDYADLVDTDDWDDTDDSFDGYADDDWENDDLEEDDNWDSDWDDELEEEGEWYYITSDYKPGIAVRSEPTKDSELLCRIPRGTSFYVQYLIGSWGYTTVNGVTGWIDTDYAEIDNDIWFDGWATNSDFFEDGSAIYSDEYILPESEYMYLTKSDISHLTKKGLCYARNEIYARYGRKFKAKELQEYFDSTVWYHAKYEPTESNDKKISEKMNKYERYNVDLLLSIEKKSGMYPVK